MSGGFDGVAVLAGLFVSSSLPALATGATYAVTRDASTSRRVGQVALSAFLLYAGYKLHSLTDTLQGRRITQGLMASGALLALTLRRRSRAQSVAEWTALTINLLALGGVSLFFLANR